MGIVAAQAGAQATRSPSRSAACAATTARSGRSAITDSSRAASSTVRAIGPSTDRSSGSASGHEATSPTEGRKPTTPQKLAGFRNDPPRSLPSAIGTIPLASAAAAPPDEPPALLDGS